MKINKVGVIGAWGSIFLVGDLKSGLGVDTDTRSAEDTPRNFRYDSIASKLKKQQSQMGSVE